MKLFPANSSIDLISLGFLCRLPKKNIGSEKHFLMKYQYPNQTRDLKILQRTPIIVSTAVVAHLVFKFGIPNWGFSYKGLKDLSKFFEAV